MLMELKASSFEENFLKNILSWAPLFQGKLAFQFMIETLVAIQLLRRGKCMAP